MGYYVRGNGHIVINRNDLSQAYKALCDLNEKDELKRGGRYGGPDGSESPRPAGLNYHPARWFSWMDANYPETCPDAYAVLRQVGFHLTELSQPGMSEDYIRLELEYDEKTGQEELFMEALAPYVLTGEIYWDGEDGAKWREVFANGTYKVQGATVVYADDASVRPV